VAATAAVAAVVGYEVLWSLAKYWRFDAWEAITADTWPGILHWAEFYPTNITTNVTGAILGTWTFLALAGSWRARDDWRDWLGRWLAWAWLVNVAFHPFSVILWG
jgi:hypothetical protein